MGPIRPNPLGSLVGARLAHYRVLTRVGEGESTLVFKAVDEQLDRPAVLKVLRPERATDDERRRRFLRDARAAAALSHPNVAATYEVGEADGVAFVAGEWIQGTTLRARLDRGRMPPAEAVRVARQVARALAKAHERGLIHRGLRPEEVMLDEEREVKVGDFGLAEPDVLERGGVAAAYASPEQAAGRPIDARTDLFALGVILYEMLTGVRPFRGTTPIETVVAVTRDDPGPPSAIASDVPVVLDRVVATCLAKQPEQRYPSARDVMRALDAVLDAIDADHPPERPSQPSRRTSVAPPAASSVAPPAAAFGSGTRRPLPDRLADCLAVYLGPHTGRVAVKTFALRALGRGPETITVADLPRLEQALRPMLRTLLGKARCEAVLEQVRRELSP